MKKLLLKGLFAVAMLLGLGFSASAQVQVTVPELPADSAVRIGKLDNGLTYYIRHNETPKGQADFFIAQNVGSILEDENQRGLAHFLEHMCFNGTESFPGNSLIDWLESVGVKFGYNLNAYTGLDETVYNISCVPVDRKSVQDSCLIILHDWADGLLLDPAEIDKERGVIHQEWRVNNVGQMRILEQLLPKIYPGSKYGERLPIGLMSVVDNFEPQVLRDYYEKWYRPDQQAVIVIGDIDPDYIEGKIKELFSPIKMPDPVAERTHEPVPDNEGTIYAIGKDKEMSQPIMMLMFKLKEKLLPDEFKNTQAFFAVDYLKHMATYMLNERLDEMAKQSDAKFTGPAVEIGDFFIAPTKDAVLLQVISKDDAPAALQAAYAELLRASRHGFTVSEYERAKAQYMSNMERSYDQRAKRENTSYAREYAANFTRNEPAPGIEYEYEMAQQLTQTLPLEAINMLLPQLIASKDNRVLLGMFPDNDTFVVPTEQQLAAAIDAAEAMELEPYKDDVKETPLIPTLPTPNAPKTITTDEANGITTLTYANGITVNIKPTDFKANDIQVSGVAKGGLSTTDPVDAASVQFLPLAMTMYGLGDYTNMDMQKYLQGKQVKIDVTFDDYMVSVDGSTTPKDVKTFMECLYMYLTDIEFSEKDFAAAQQRYISLLANREKDPQFTFGKGLYESLYDAPAKQLITGEAIKKADREVVSRIVHNMMSHPQRFTFNFVGDIDMDTFVPLVNQYLGSISANRMAAVPYMVNPAFEPKKGEATTSKTTVMETPQTWVAVTASASVPYSAKARYETSIFSQVLSKRLLNKIREEMGAVYSIGASAAMTRLGDQNVLLQIPFPMDPAKRTLVLDEINKILNDVATNGPTEDEVNAFKEYMVKSAKENLVKNEQWASALAGKALNGVDTFTTAIDTINSITPADVADLASRIVKSGNLRVFTLDPAE